MNDEENQNPLDLATNELDGQSDDLAKRANDANEEADRKAEALFQHLYRLAIDDNNKATRGLRIFPGELEEERDPETLRQLIKIANRRAGQLWKLSTSGQASEALIFHRAELLETVMNWIEEKIEKYETSTGELFEPTDAGLAFFDYSDLCPYEELPTPVERLLIPEKYILQPMTNKQFGRLKVICQIGKTASSKPIMLCRCKCGNFRLVRADHLSDNKTASCGCLNREISGARWRKHGGSNSRLYDIWLSMRSRCFRKTAINYKRYGGKGITVCPEWNVSFEVFRDWALSQGYADDLTLDRKNNEGPYSPDNCRWATQKEQQNNRANNVRVEYEGQTMNLSEAARASGIPYNTLQRRYISGDNGDRLFRPVRHKT